MSAQPPKTDEQKTKQFCLTVLVTENTAPVSDSEKLAVSIGVLKCGVAARGKDRVFAVSGNNLFTILKLIGKKLADVSIIVISPTSAETTRGKNSWDCLLAALRKKCALPETRDYVALDVRAIRAGAEPNPVVFAAS